MIIPFKILFFYLKKISEINKLQGQNRGFSTDAFGFLLLLTLCRWKIDEHDCEVESLVVQERFREVTCPEINKYCHSNKVHSLVPCLFLLSFMFPILLYYGIFRRRRIRRLLNRMALPKRDLAPSRKVVKLPISPCK